MSRRHLTCFCLGRVGWWWISARLNTGLLFRCCFCTAWADFSRPKQLFFIFIYLFIFNTGFTHTGCVAFLLDPLPAGVPSAARRVMLDVRLLWHVNGFGGSSLRCCRVLKQRGQNWCVKKAHKKDEDLKVPSWGKIVLIFFFFFLRRKMYL